MDDAFISALLGQTVAVANGPILLAAVASFYRVVGRDFYADSPNAQMDIESTLLHHLRLLLLLCHVSYGTKAL